MANSEGPTDRLSDMTQRIVAFRDAREWAAFHGWKDEVLSLVSEVGELAEWFRWYEGDALTAHVKDHHEDVADELADVLYWTLLLAHDAGVDLGAAFDAKMTKNAEKYPVEMARGSARKYDALHRDVPGGDPTDATDEER